MPMAFSALLLLPLRNFIAFLAFTIAMLVSSLLAALQHALSRAQQRSGRAEHRFADWPCMLSTALCQCTYLHLLGLATVDYFSMAFFLKKLLATFSFQNLTFHSSCASNLTLPAASSTLPLVLQLELAWMHSTLVWRYAGGI